MATEAERDELSGEVLPPEESAEDESVDSDYEVSPGEEALPIIYAPHLDDEGGRTVSIGAPGFGKTTTLGLVLDHGLRAGHLDLVLTVDDKRRVAEFKGHERSNPGPPWTDDHPQSLRTIPVGPRDRPQHVVFRGDMKEGIPADADSIARLALWMARELGVRVAFNVNELDKCLTDGGKSWICPNVRLVITQGRASRCWFFATTQQPQRIPNEPYDQATAVLIHKLVARAARYMENTLQLEEELTDLLPILKRGEFVVHQPGLEWNGKVYKFDVTPK